MAPLAPRPCSRRSGSPAAVCRRRCSCSSPAWTREDCHALVIPSTARDQGRQRAALASDIYIPSDPSQARDDRRALIEVEPANLVGGEFELGGVEAAVQLIHGARANQRKDV